MSLIRRVIARVFRRRKPQQPEDASIYPMF